MNIKVTDCETGKETIYKYSKDNWANRYACMDTNGLVHMWAPKEVSTGIIKTSGRKWQLVK